MKRLLILLMAIIAVLASATAVRWFTLPLIVRAQTNTFCANNLTCAVTAAWKFKNIGNVRNIDPANTVGWSGATIDTWVTAAIADIGSSGGTIQIAPGAYTAAATISNGGQANISIVGAGSPSVQITCPTGVDCMRWRSNPFTQLSNNPTLKGFTLIGNSNASSNGLHYGDIMNGTLEDIVITGNGVTVGFGGIGLWFDNVLGFTERSTVRSVQIDTGTAGSVGWKFTNSSASCVAQSASFSYNVVNGVFMRVNSGATGMEIGPGVSMSHVWEYVQMNGGQNASKTFFKMDAAAAPCGAAGMNNGTFYLDTEDTNGGGGTFVNIATGATLAGDCHLHTFNFAPPMTNTISGTLACSSYLGPTGNQPTFDSRLFSATQEQGTLSSDGAGIDMTLALTRNNVQPISTDFGISIIGNAGDSCSGSTQGDVCIRNYNVGNQITFAGSGGTSSFAVTNTGFKGAAGSVVTSTGGGGTLAVLGVAQTFTAAQTFGAGSSINFPNLLISQTVPTIAAAGCGGAAAAITAPNGTGSFEVSVGTTPGSACTITMPAATTSWTCDANTVSATTTTNFYVKQTGALSTTSVVLTLFSDVAAATAYQGSDTLRVKCSAN